MEGLWGYSLREKEITMNWWKRGRRREKYKEKNVTASREKFGPRLVDSGMPAIRLKEGGQR